MKWSDEVGIQAAFRDWAHMTDDMLCDILNDMAKIRPVSQLSDRYLHRCLNFSYSEIRELRRREP